MFPKKFYGLVFSFVMSVLMSALMSLVITLLHVGIRPGVVIDWLKAGAFHGLLLGQQS